MSKTPSSTLEPPIAWFRTQPSEFTAPIEVKAVRLDEEATHTKQWTFIAIGGAVHGATWTQLPDLDLTSVPEGLRMAFANFREGLNSFNVFYKFLCFFKVAQYCQDRTTQDERKHRKVGQESRRPQHVISSDLGGIADDDAVHVRPYAGKTYDEVLKAFKPIVRNAIAHLTPGKQAVSQDSFKDLMRCTESVPIVQHIAQQLLLDRYKSGRY